MIRALAKMLDIDPCGVAYARLDLAERALSEAENYISKHDPVQASEKLYKAVEECIKALAEFYSVSRLDEVERKGRWDTWILGKASRELAERLREDRIRLAWKDAYDTHAWGFHKANYDLEDIKS